MPDPAIEAFLARYPAALVAGDLDAVAGFWALPALVVARGRTVAVTEEAQLRDFFAGGATRLRQLGATRQEAARHEARRLAPGLALLDVDWDLRGPDGRSLAVNPWTYALRTDEAGTRIVAAFAREG